MFQRATVPNKLPDISKMELTPKQIEAIQAILLAPGPHTHGNTLLVTRRPDTDPVVLREAAEAVQMQKQAEADARSLEASRHIVGKEGFREWYARFWKPATAIDARRNPDNYSTWQKVRLGVWAPTGSK